MHPLRPLLSLLLAISTVALENPHNRVPQGQTARRTPDVTEPGPVSDPSNYKYLNSKTEKFLVNGTALPEFNFDIGESYSGLLANTPAGNSSLFFWFFPSGNVNASDEITIWLNGGPGSSSLVGMLQENGPFLWQEGTYRPTPNPYSWTNLTNVVWVDQPAGVGFSPGPTTVKNEEDVSHQFKDFFRRFVDTFDLHGRKVYIIGESYAGQYIPYIAAGMLDEEDTEYFNVKGIQINDPSINSDDILTEIPSVAVMNYYQNLFNVNATFIEQINQADDECGFTKYLNEAISYPPKIPFPEPPAVTAECSLWEEIVGAAMYVNPCFNPYHITDYCPFLWNEVNIMSYAGGPSNYFNNTEVQNVLNIPPTNYIVYNPNLFVNDTSVPAALGPLPSVIERTNNTLIGHGWLDYLLLANGTLITIQNMTWNGAQGFQQPPIEPLFVPYHESLTRLQNGAPSVPFLDNAGAGYMGTAHTERGLTFSSVFAAGHEIPQYVPGAAYRQLEFLLGRIGNLSDIESYTTA